MKTHNTGIRIETVKKVSDTGEIGYKVTSVAALKQNELPKMYLEGKRPDAFQGGEYLVLRLASNASTLGVDATVTPLICVNDFYTQEDMDKINAHIRAAGQHLADVNAHLRKERDTWNGKVTFVDGVEQEQEKDILSKKHSAEQLYKITDGSWNLCSTKTDPIMKHFPGLVRCVDNKYRIIDQGCDLLAYSPAHLRAPKRNDTIIQNIDTGQIVFTCKRFLCQI